MTDFTVVSTSSSSSRTQSTLPSPNRRLLFCDSLPFWGGGEHWIVQVASALEARGWRVTVGGRRRSELLHRARLAGLQAIAWGFDHDFDLATIRASSRWIDSFQPTLVLVTTARDIRTVGLAARRHRVPVVWRMGPKPRESFIHRVTGQRVVTKVIAPSHYVADELTPFPWLTDKVEVIHNGISITDRPTADQVEEARLDIGIHGDQFVILYVGRLMLGKGLDVLIEAFEMVHAERPNTRLIVVGSGPEEAEFKALARDLKVDSAVDFRGYTPDPTRYFDACDLFVLPSRYESFSHVLLEAMIRAKPCIATRAGAVPEVVGEKAAFLCPTDDPKALAETMMPVIENPIRRELLAAQGRNYVVAHYDLNRTVDAVEKLFVSLVPAQR